jgi:hypothetical protein
MKYNAFFVVCLMVCLSVVYCDERKREARDILGVQIPSNVTIMSCQSNSDCSSSYMCLQPISSVPGVCTPSLTGAGTINGYHFIYTIVLTTLALILL